MYKRQVYIGTWEVRCPYCSKYTPLVGNWWLARVKGSRGFESLAWMTPAKVEDGVEVRVNQVRDPKELQLARTVTKGGRAVGIEVDGRRVTVGDPALGGEPNVDARNSRATCLYCYAEISGVRDRWYVKEALREWNEKLEKYLNGEIDLEELKHSPARPRILVKVKIIDRDLVFEPAAREDNEKLWRALEKLKAMWGDPDIPTEPIPPYGSRYLFPILYGFDRWYRLFNPRQLITLVKLTKLIKEAGKRIEEELKEGWTREDAHKYAEAVTTYLAIALIRLVNFNSTVTTWYSGSLLTNKVQSSLSFRGLAMTWNWCDTNVLYEEGNQYSIKSNINSIVRALNYLVSAVSGSPSRVCLLYTSDAADE